MFETKAVLCSCIVLYRCTILYSFTLKYSCTVLYCTVVLFNFTAVPIFLVTGWTLKCTIFIFYNKQLNKFNNNTDAVPAGIDEMMIIFYLKKIWMWSLWSWKDDFLSIALHVYEGGFVFRGLAFLLTRRIVL